jgi:hypothetical protein
MPVRRQPIVRHVLSLAIVVGFSGAAAAGDNPGAQPAPTPAASPAPAPAPATTAPAAPPKDTGVATPPPATGAASYAYRLRDLERRVNELKEAVFRSKARLNLLKETVLHGVIAGSRAVIVHRNEMGSMYMPIRYTYALDGTEIYAKSDESGKLGEQKEIEIFNGALVPGNHTLSVTMVYQGNGAIFTYLKGYTFTAHSSHTFTAGEGKQLQLKVVGFEKGNPITTDPKDRPAVDFRENVITDKDAAAKQQPAPAQK